VLGSVRLAEPVVSVVVRVGVRENADALGADCRPLGRKLNRYLESHAASDSIIEMAQHCTLYSSIMDIVSLFCTHDRLTFLVRKLPHQAISLANLVRSQHTMVAKFKSRLGVHGSAVDSSGFEAVRVADRIAAVAAQLPDDDSADAGSQSDGGSGPRVTRSGKGRAGKGRASRRTTTAAAAAADASALDGGASAAAPCSDEDAYVTALRALQMDEMDIIDDGPHHYLVRILNAHI
jgi:hypothetical protein